ncbi:MAG TPA: vitamin K epoxide reductase family protein [Ktedonobacterales bacterium]|nr:vitamin K epoxide reductase family protein [Ktedonobacterales bacterium]
MDVVKRERGAVALLAMAVVGVGIAIYLTAVHYAKVPLVCSTSGVVDCGPVLKSNFSVVPGTQLPITVPGMLWFIVSGGLAVTALRASLRGRAEPDRLRLAQLIWSAAGLLFALYLVYAELVQLRHICAWCTGIHILTLLTFLVALARWQATLLPESTGSPRRDATLTRAPSSSSLENRATLTARRSTMPAGPAVSRRAAKSVNQRATTRARGK